MDDKYEELAERLRDYRCTGQMSLFEMYPEQLAEKEEPPSEFERMEYEIVGQMSLFDMGLQ